MSIWNDAPEQPQNVDNQPVQPEVVEQPKTQGFVGLPVRAGDDRVWILKGGKRHWVTSADVFSGLGFKFGDEREIDKETLTALPEGEPIR